MSTDHVSGGACLRRCSYLERYPARRNHVSGCSMQSISELLTAECVYYNACASLDRVRCHDSVAVLACLYLK